MILKDRMRLHKLYVKLSHMVRIFIEIFDTKVLYAIYSMVSRQNGNGTYLKKMKKSLWLITKEHIFDVAMSNVPWRMDT